MSRYMMPYHFGGEHGHHSDACTAEPVFPLIEQVNDDRKPVEITSRRGHAVLMSLEDYEELTETAYLLRAPANARRLLQSLQQAAAGEREEHTLSR